MRRLTKTEKMLGFSAGDAHHEHMRRELLHYPRKAADRGRSIVEAYAKGSHAFGDVTIDEDVYNDVLVDIVLAAARQGIDAEELIERVNRNFHIEKHGL